MQPKHIVVNKEFIGRTHEQQRLRDLEKTDRAQILVVYGRRRIGKTELLEQVFHDTNVLKFEGLEGLEENRQRDHVMAELAKYTEDPTLVEQPAKNWVEVFQHIAHYVKTGRWVVYFEEVQWLADYQHEFIAALKYVWDNELRHNKELLVILCGSSPSFVIGKILHSKALYNRAQYELPIHEINLMDAAQFLKGKSKRDVLDAYLTLGGMPEYLLKIRDYSSVLLGICEESFKSGGFFVDEYQRIFTSSLSKEDHAQTIIEFLSHRRFATRDEIAKHLKLASGGGLTDYLDNLEKCGFIAKYTPFHLGDGSHLARYCITDAYLQFYFKFIAPIRRKIMQGVYDSMTLKALNMNAYHTWLGYAFERFCRRYHHILARILEFSAVEYQVGAYFARKENPSIPGYQIDLVFARKDRVYTVCEMKYLNNPAEYKVAEEMDRKMMYFPPAEKGETIHRVLVAPQGASQALINRPYFDRIITLDDLFDPHYWR